MRPLTAVLLLALVPATLPAQTAQTAQTAPPALTDTDSAATLRQLIRQRWHQHIVTQLELNSDQATKLQATEDKYDGLRQPIQQRQVAIAAALTQQMQPGVAADDEVVTKLLDEREANRAKLQDLERQQDREMAAYLTPVQRVRYQRQREMFIHRLQQLRERRQPRGFRSGRRFR